MQGVARVVAIASCKGGVGKTTVAVNLALLLRREGLRVGLFDADLYGPNVPLMLGIRREKASFPMMGLRKGRPAMGFIPIARSDSTPYLQPKRRFGLKVMSLGLWYGDTGPITDNARVGARMVLQTLSDVQWELLDILILDLPPGTGDFQEAVIKEVPIDGIVLVTTPQDMAMMDTGRSLRLFQKAGLPVLGYVENMAYMTCPHCGMEMGVFEMTRKDLSAILSLPCLGRIPLDPALSRPIDADHPLTQSTLDSPRAIVFHHLGQEIMSRLKRSDLTSG